MGWRQRWPRVWIRYAGEGGGGERGMWTEAGVPMASHKGVDKGVDMTGVLNLQ